LILDVEASRLRRHSRTLRHLPCAIVARRLARNSRAVGMIYYLDELARRDSARQQTTMIRVTNAIVGMTLVITIATIVNRIVFIAS
jgi:hypothetical protein